MVSDYSQTANQLIEMVHLLVITYLELADYYDHEPTG